MNYPVLPLAAGEKRPHPVLAPRGLRSATTDPEVARGWFTTDPAAGLGILPPQDVLVLDFDSPTAWDELSSAFPEIAEAPRQRTPRGYHVFLRLPAETGLSTSARALPGIDLRGLGRAYLVAAPTVLPSGEYHWDVPLRPPAELPPVPNGLLLRLLPAPPAPPPPATPHHQTQNRRVEGLLRWACERVEAAPEGQRHTTLLQYSRLVGGWLLWGLSAERAIQELASAGQRAGLPLSEAVNTARDGVEYGQTQPLELPEREPPHAPAPAPRVVGGWPEPEPLDTAARLRPWPGGAILPPEIEDFGLAFADRLCIDPAPVMMTMLTATSAVTNGRVWIEPDADNPTWREPTALWLAVVMRVSTKKTPLLKAALSPLWRIEEELREEHEQAMAEYEAELARWEGAKRAERGGKPTPPVPQRLLAQDATREALAELLANNRGILAYHDELAGLFRSWEREDRGADRAFYLSAYSAAPVVVDRILRGSSYIPAPVLSLIGFVQPGPFRERVLEAQSGDKSGADGLLQRFVVVTAQEREWADERPAIPLAARERYHDTILRLYDTLRHGPERVLRFTPEAQALWYGWEGQTEREIRHPDHPEAWQALLGKRLGLTARLAAVLARLWEEPGGVVSATTLRRAIALVLWLEPHARRIWHRALMGNDEPVLKLGRKLKDGGLDSFTERHLAHRNVAGISTIGEARRVVERLLEAGWVTREGDGYRVNPRVREVEGV